ncbi:MAG: nucleoside transporter C-terminal domain-containing protein [Acidobacteriota bacterium]|nr:nucleoside transporter C-terminal domain-containing protein [Acidobacteriota bacterium]
MNFQLTNLMSIVGLVSLLGLAWLMSYHRGAVKLRPILAGMGIQFTLAMIIMPDEEKLSFTGMAVFALLLIIYIMKDKQSLPNPFMNHLIHGFYAVIVGTALYYTGNASLLGGLALVTLLLLVVNGFVLKNPAVGRYGAVFLLCAFVAYLMVSGMNGKALFQMFTDKVKAFLALSDYGATFLFGFQWYETVDNDSFPGFGATFAFRVLPTIIFFGGFMSVLYYLGIVQKVITAMSHFMRWAMGTSGSESLSCSANIFVGQTEAPLLVRPFLDGMTKSELLTIMVGGFATIAGGVLAGYISMGVDPGHLIAASVMSAPAALVVAKIIYPEQEHSKTAGDVEIPKLDSGDNVLEAASKGITDGLKLGLNVGAMLIGFIALIGVIDVLLNWLDGIIDGTLLGGTHIMYADAGLSPAKGEFQGIFPGSLQTVFGSLLQYLAFLMGVPWEDAPAVGNLLGIKLSLNEFVAYGQLGTYIQNGTLGPRGELVATYALCGFANFSSIGIQLGGLSALAPDRRKDLSRVAMKAMFGGAIASWTTACVAGIFF